MFTGHALGGCYGRDRAQLAARYGSRVGVYTARSPAYRMADAQGPRGMQVFYPTKRTSTTESDDEFFQEEGSSVAPLATALDPRLGNGKKKCMYNHFKTTSPTYQITTKRKKKCKKRGEEELVSKPRKRKEVGI